jgi:HEAT repeat protein
MELKDLEEVVENMILQHSYPGYEARALKLALPVALNNAPAKVYAQALGSNNVYVQLAALRWFQSRSGLTNSQALLVGSLLENSDAWVKTEAVRTIELTKIFDSKIILKILPLLKDPDQMVRIEAAKALGNLAKEIQKLKSPSKANIDKHSDSENNESIKDKIIVCLQEAAEDKVLDVRRKAIKSLRKLGAFSTS